MASPYSDNSTHAVPKNRDFNCVGAAAADEAPMS
jgi:hypothetical protein